MTSRAFLVAALTAAVVGPASARPRHPDRSNDDAPSSDDGDDIPAAGPEARAMMPVKIDDLIEIAVRLSPDLARAKSDRLAAKHAAGASEQPQAWVLTSGVQYTRSGIADSVEAPPFSVVATDRLEGQLGLGRNLASGGAVSLEADVSHATQEYSVLDTLQNAPAVQTQAGGGGGTGAGTGGAGTGSGAGGGAGGGAGTNPLEFMDMNQTALRLTFKQPLGRGFGSKVALAPERKAQLEFSEATIKAQIAAEEMIRDLVIGYWEVAYASYAVDVQRQAVDLAKKQEKLTREQMSAGLQPSTAIDDVNYQLSMRQEALLSAQMDLEAQSLELRRKAGLEIDHRGVVLHPEDPFAIGDDQIDVEDELARTNDANRQLATVELEQKIADVDVDVAADGTKPQVDLSVAGALTGQGDDTGSAINGIGSGFEVTVGLSVSIELSGAARHAQQAAAAHRHRLDIDRADLARQLDTQVVAAVHEVTAARQRAALADRAIAVAEDTVRAQYAAFMAGRVSNFEVLQHQSELIDARLRRGRAIADYHVALVKLQFLTGELLDTYGVDVRPHDR